MKICPQCGRARPKSHGVNPTCNHCRAESGRRIRAEIAKRIITGWRAGEVAAKLNMKLKLVEWHWGKAMRLMRAAGCLALLVCVAAVPPVPKAPKKHVTPLTQGAGAKQLIAKSVVIPPRWHTNTFVWRYPPSINPSNYWWDIQCSTDLVHWVTVTTHATGDYWVTNTGSRRVFRLYGYL